MSDLGPLKSASGMLAAARHVQSGRIRAIAENIANADSTAPTAGGTPYARKIAAFSPVIPDAPDDPIGRIVRDASDFPSKYEPGSAVADAKGFVTLPNVNAALESADLQTAIRNYELNLGASASIDAASRATLDLLR